MRAKRSIYLGWMAMASTVGLIVSSAVIDAGSDQVLRVVGVVCLLCSPILFIPPFVLLARWGKAENERTYMETTTVVSQGPYRIVRHPQYLGYMFLGGGFALLAQHWVALALGLLSIGTFSALAAAEEEELLERFGDSYAAYCQRVPRFNVVVGMVRYLKSRAA